MEEAKYRERKKRKNCANPGVVPFNLLSVHPFLNIAIETVQLVFCFFHLKF